MIKRLRSISGIQKVFDTNRSPVLVLANDFNDYLCKHSRHVPANYLFSDKWKQRAFIHFTYLIQKVQQ